jgi:hypothetical protein
MLQFLSAQFLIILFAVLIANKETVAVRMAREYVPTPNPFNEPFHFYGYSASVVFVILAVLYQQSIEAMVLIAPLSALWYWVAFDYVINTEVFEKWDYVGYTSKIDKWLRRHWGNKAGKRKFWFSVAAIAVLNLIYFL